MSQNIRIDFTSGQYTTSTATDVSQFTYTFAQTASTTGMSVRASDGRVSGDTRGTTTGGTRDLWVSVTGTGYSNVTITGTAKATQASNYVSGVTPGSTFSMNALRKEAIP